MLTYKELLVNIIRSYTQNQITKYDNKTSKATKVHMKPLIAKNSFFHVQVLRRQKKRQQLKHIRSSICFSQKIMIRVLV